MSGGSCSLTTTIHKNVTKTIYEYIYHDYEVSGIISITDMDENNTNDNKKKKNLKTSKSYKSIQNNEVVHGKKSSVHTKNAVYNYHLHPLCCYKAGGCLFGWISGEDIRSCIEMALEGNKAHFVFCLEGLYVMRIKSNFLTKFKEHKNQKIILDVIEDYFKSSHEFRTVDHLKKFNIENYDNLPYDIVKVINDFKLQKLCGKKKHETVKNSKIIDENHMKSKISKKNMKNFNTLKDSDKLFKEAIFDCKFCPSNLFRDNLFKTKKTISSVLKDKVPLPEIHLEDDIIMFETYPSEGKDICSMKYLETQIEKKQIEKKQKNKHKIR